MKNVIGEYIKQHKTSAYQVALLCRLDPATVGRHVQGKEMSVASARKYSTHLGIPLEKLLGGGRETPKAA